VCFFAHNKVNLCCALSMVVAVLWQRQSEENVSPPATWWWQRRRGGSSGWGLFFYLMLVVRWRTTKASPCAPTKGSRQIALCRAVCCRAAFVMRNGEMRTANPSPCVLFGALPCAGARQKERFLVVRPAHGNTYI
jgi:hypothetical protein